MKKYNLRCLSEIDLKGNSHWGDGYCTIRCDAPRGHEDACRHIYFDKENHPRGVATRVEIKWQMVISPI